MIPHPVTHVSTALQQRGSVATCVKATRDGFVSAAQVLHCPTARGSSALLPARGVCRRTLLGPCKQPPTPPLPPPLPRPRPPHFLGAPRAVCRRRRQLRHGRIPSHRATPRQHVGLAGGVRRGNAGGQADLEAPAGGLSPCLTAPAALCARVQAVQHRGNSCACTLRQNQREGRATPERASCAESRLRSEACPTPLARPASCMHMSAQSLLHSAQPASRAFSPARPPTCGRRRPPAAAGTHTG